MKAPAPSPKLLIIAAAGIAAVGGGIWAYKHREPPDLTEEQAKAKAESEFQQGCGDTEGGVIGPCMDFRLAAQEPSSDKRFHWAFRYENMKPARAQRILVLVGKKGEVSTNVGFFVPDAAARAAFLAGRSAPAPSGKPAASPAPPAAAAAAGPAAAPAAAAPAQAPAAKALAETALSWSLCELPPTPQ